MKSAAWGDLPAPIPLLRGGRSSPRDEECACCRSQAIFQRLSKIHSDTMTSTSPFKVALHSMMDLVIKQLWPIPITLLRAAAQQDGCLLTASTFKSPQAENDRSSPPSGSVRVTVLSELPSRIKVPFISLHCIFIGVWEERVHHI